MPSHSAQENSGQNNKQNNKPKKVLCGSITCQKHRLHIWQELFSTHAVAFLWKRLKQVSLFTKSLHTFPIMLNSWCVVIVSLNLLSKETIIVWEKTLKVVSATFLLFCFVSLKESFCETRRNVFYFTSILKKSKVWNFRYSNFKMSSNASA